MSEDWRTSSVSPEQRYWTVGRLAWAIGLGIAVGVSLTGLIGAVVHTLWLYFVVEPELAKLLKRLVKPAS